MIMVNKDDIQKENNKSIKNITKLKIAIIMVTTLAAKALSVSTTLCAI